MWARAVVKALSLPMFILFGQSMVKLWAVSPVHVVALSMLFLSFSIASMWIVDVYDKSTLSDRRH